MRAGKLDKLITIESAVTTVDPHGTPTVAWVLAATTRAQIVTGSTEEFIRGQGASSETAIVFRMRWLDGVTVANRVTFEGNPFDIKEAKELGRRRGLDLRCVRVGP